MSDWTPTMMTQQLISKPLFYYFKMKYYQVILILFSFCTILSCSDNSQDDAAEQETVTHSVPLVLSSTPPSFDGDAGTPSGTDTRGRTTEWPDGARLYFRFTNGGSPVAGSSVYSAASGEWTLHYTGSLSEIADDAACEVWYFEGAAKADDSGADLPATTAVYHTSEASYYYNAGRMSVTATLKPTMARVRFSGNAGTELKLTGWPCPKKYTSATWSITSDETDALTLTVGSDGYTPYVYGTIAGNDVQTLRVDNDNVSFYRDFEPSEILAGHGYSIAVPTEDMVTAGKWRHNLNPYRTFTITGNGKTVTFKMIKVNNGTFEMGSTDWTVSTPVHNVTISKSYYICETEVTQALWYAVMGQSPTKLDNYQWNSEYGLGDEYPAYYISYKDCQSFLSTLNSQLSSQLSDGEQFRFPTEAEWEFAARGGNKSLGYDYSGSNAVYNVSWYNENSGGKTHEVTNKAANELGIYDMSGNVSEWCYDWYGDYSSDAQYDPTGPISGSERVLRGGSWNVHDFWGYVYYREQNTPSSYSALHGFRLALDAPVSYLSVASSSLSFDAPASSLQLAVSASGEYSYSSSASWLTVTQSSDKTTLTVSAEANTGTSARTATITLTLGSLTKTISVFQNSDDERFFTITGNGKTVTFKMIKVEGGTFQMGSTSGYSDETPIHSVTLTKDYYMGETEVTQALWYAVMGYSPTSNYYSWSSPYGLGDEYPTYYINYNDCQSFLSALNSKLSSQLSSGESFRFPTEAEWEFAAKGGNKSKGYTYSGSNTIGDVAWYTDNSGSTTHPVKTKSPNELGLYDMSGNVWEWCYDWSGSYSSGAQTDPTGPTSGSYRVNRGGGCGDSATGLASRNGLTPSYRSSNIGLRLCLAAPIE